MQVKLPKIRLKREIISDFDKTIGREWIIANGLGGYASSTVLGINTRKYHGLLVAAFNPPVDRWVILSKLDEEVRIEDRTYQVGSNEFRNNINPKGYRLLRDFSLVPLPIYKYVANGVELQKTIFMPHGKNATIFVYEVANSHDEEAKIRVSPLINSRHFHAVTDKDSIDWSFIQRQFEQGVTIQQSFPTSTLIFSSDKGQYLADKGEWIEKMYYRVEASRGESCLDDGFQPGWFELSVDSKDTKKFYVVAVAGKSEEEAKQVLSSIPKGLEDIEALYSQELERLKNLQTAFQRQHADVATKDWLKWLILAADSFITDRRSTRKKSVIAGYHWFGDWGRDSLISLPGLTLVTGRFGEAREILLTFRQYCQEGIIPNRFPDQAGDKPAYNTVDATLWFFNGILQYLKYTKDFEFVKEEMWDTLKSIIEYHVQGTLYAIRVDDDGLLKHGPQLTWMDAKANDLIVTPRDGKAVEIQALWYNALKTMELLARRFNQQEEFERYSVMAGRARDNFARKFWHSEKRFLYDFIRDDVRDASLRPNQILAVSLDFSLLDKIRQERVVETTWRQLWGTYGLRTLPKDDARYAGQYYGNRIQRDNAYHNGTVWAWLVGPFTTAFLKVKNYDDRWRRFAFENFLKPLFNRAVFQAGIGTINEIFDGDPPHMPRGCIAQAWSVAEPLRACVEDILTRRPVHEREILEFADR